MTSRFLRGATFSTSQPAGGVLDSLLKRVEERWSFIEDPQHLKGMLQTLRRCQSLGRLLPKGIKNTNKQEELANPKGLVAAIIHRTNKCVCSLAPVPEVEELSPPPTESRLKLYY